MRPFLNRRHDSYNFGIIRIPHGFDLLLLLLSVVRYISNSCIQHTRKNIHTYITHTYTRANLISRQDVETVSSPCFAKFL